MTNFYQILIFAILIGIKGDVMPMRSQYFMVNLNSFITQRQITLGNQHIW